VELRVRDTYGFDPRRFVGSVLWKSGVVLLLLVIVIANSGNPAQNSTLARLFGAAYPLSDLLLAWLSVQCLRSSRDNMSSLLTLAGVLSFAIADTAFAIETAANSYGIGNGFDTGWVLGYLLIGLGAVYPLAWRYARSAGFAGGRSVAVAFTSGPSTAWLTVERVGHLVNGVGVLLIAADAGVTLYDLSLVLRSI
jgi:hypothetical protein